jgi:hypothetical protein
MSDGIPLIVGMDNAQLMFSPIERTICCWGLAKSSAMLGIMKEKIDRLYGTEPIILVIFIESVFLCE